MSRSFSIFLRLISTTWHRLQLPPSTLSAAFTPPLSPSLYFLLADMVMPPRPLRPKDEPETSDGIDGTPEPKSNKRRAVSSACIPCRKRKSKVRRLFPIAYLQNTDQDHSVMAHYHLVRHAPQYTELSAITTLIAITGEKEL